jgi:hypothetical protein
MFSDRESQKYESYTKLPADQVDRSAHGYRVFYTSENGVVEELTFAPMNWGFPLDEIEELPEVVREKFKNINKESLKRGATIVKDLEPGQRGFVNIVYYTRVRTFNDNKAGQTYAEIHIPKDQDISTCGRK